MKTFGLLVTIALVLPLAACERRDRCDSNGWCQDTTAVVQCYSNRDCAPNNRCDQGICIPDLPVPPGRGAGGASGGGASGGSSGKDAGVDVHGAGGSGVGGSVVSGYGGSTGQGGSVVSGTGGSVISGVGGSVVSGYGGSTGQGGSVVSGAGGSTPPPADAGAPHTCGDGGSSNCHPHATPVCEFDHDCGLTGRCLDGECQAGCTANAGCGTGQVCTQGYCVTSTTSGAQCVFNADCGGSATCINGYCHADCSANADCAAKGQGLDVCVAGICQPDTGPHPQCRGNTDCVGVHVTEDVCVDAVCRTPCFSNDDCCVGSSGSVCQMGYCVTAHEVAPQCHISADCGTALTCIDATCE